MSISWKNWPPPFVPDKTPEQLEQIKKDSEMAVLESYLMRYNIDANDPMKAAIECARARLHAVHCHDSISALLKIISEVEIKCTGNCVPRCKSHEVIKNAKRLISKKDY